MNLKIDFPLNIQEYIGFRNYVQFRGPNVQLCKLICTLYFDLAIFEMKLWSVVVVSS